MNLRRHLKSLPIEALRNPPPVVAVIRFDGIIGPQQWRGTISLATHASALERAFALPDLAAVALSINSPGGSPVQSALLYRRIRQLADEKNVPVVAFAEDVAASGGYWLALAGDAIFAEESSILGSIGVVSAGFGFVDLLRRWGVERRVHTAGERKSLLDPFLPEDPSDLDRLSDLQEDVHEAFKDHVRRRRGHRLDPRDETLFTGDVLTGRMALDRGLIDGIGDVRGVARARLGERVRLIPVILEKKRRRWPFSRRQRPWVAAEMADALSEVIGAVDARMRWGRFGL